jgi:hypothetical protein
MKEFQKAAMLGVLAATFSGSALGAGVNDKAVNLAWDHSPTDPSLVCAYRIYGKVLSGVPRKDQVGDGGVTYGKTLKTIDPATGRLPTTVSFNVPDFYASDRPIAEFLLTTVGKAPGKTCDQSFADNTLQFSGESNAVFFSQDLSFQCPEGALDRDGDKLCDAFEQNISHSAVTSAQSDGDGVDDYKEYLGFEEVGHGYAETLCPNGKYPLKTINCDGDAYSDAVELDDFRKKGGVNSLNPFVFNP